MILRTLANVSPRQSVMPAISASIRSDGFMRVSVILRSSYGSISAPIIPR
jgi:hypothetical protein